MASLFENIGKEIGILVKEKNEAYGSSFEKSEVVLRQLYPHGINPEQYGDLLAITRVIDKLFRVAKEKEAFGESPWEDICGYSILQIAKEVENET